MEYFIWGMIPGDNEEVRRVRQFWREIQYKGLLLRLDANASQNCLRDGGTGGWSIYLLATVPN